MNVSNRSIRDRRLKPKIIKTVGISALLLLSVGLNFFRLDQEGYGNLYYAAAVRSMLMSWHNFFFAAFDPAGFVSVDKPPLGFWIQSGSAALFGFSGRSLMLPQAIGGVLSVALLCYLVRRRFGLLAGLLAGLILTVTPISVATNRNNTPDSILILTSLLAAWFAILAAERGKPGWLTASCLLLGLGFNIKMLQAYLILPAVFLVYLLSAPIRVRNRIIHLAAPVIILGAVSLSWAVKVESTPPASRPYVGSSQTNSVFELMIRHNGLVRLGEITRWFGIDSPGDSLSGYLSQTANAGLLSETGSPGVMRLFNRQLAGQISWFLPLAVFGMITSWTDMPVRSKLHPRHQSLLFWAGWLLPQAVFFSFAGLFHRYYLAMMTPAIAALSGIGLASMWKRCLALIRNHGDPRRRSAPIFTSPLPIGLLVGMGTELFILRSYPIQAGILIPLLMGFCLLAVIGLWLSTASRGRSGGSEQTRYHLAVLSGGLGFSALLFPPAVWAAIPVWFGGDTSLPYAGPELLKQQQIMKESADESLVNYLLSQRGEEKFLLATLTARSAAPFILETGLPVMAFGGFSGSDPILDLESLHMKIEFSEVRFFLLPFGPPGSQPGLPSPQHAYPKLRTGSGSPPTLLPVPGRLSKPAAEHGGPQDELLHFISAACRKVPPLEWNQDTRIFHSSPTFPPPELEQLWDCGRR